MHPEAALPDRSDGGSGRRDADKRQRRAEQQAWHHADQKTVSDGLPSHARASASPRISPRGNEPIPRHLSARASAINEAIAAREPELAREATDDIWRTQDRDHRRWTPRR